MTPTKEQQAQEYAEKKLQARRPNSIYPLEFNKRVHTFDYYDILQAYTDGHTAGEQSLWRSVEEELPLVDQEVLCLMKSNSAVVSGFIERNKRTDKLQVATSPDFHFEDYGDYEPTHWMPIPSLPDTNTEKK